MSRVNAIVLMICLALVGGIFAHQSFATLVSRKHVKGVIVFYADWCPNCKDHNKIAAALRAKGYKVRLVNVDREPRVAARYGVTSIPQYAVVYADDTFAVVPTIIALAKILGIILALL